MQLKITLFKEISTLIPQEKLPYAHKLLKGLFSSGQLPNVEIAGRLKHFVKKGTSNKGTEYFRNCEGISNSCPFSTPATVVAKENSSQSKSNICSSGGDWKSLGKGCNRKSLYKKGFCKNSVCEQSILGKEKGWEQQFCHNFEESKSVHHPAPFQNGEPAVIKGYLQAGRLYVQIESKGCIFLHPICGGVEKIREILLGEGPISIPVSMLWTSSSPLRCYQITEDSNCLPLENRHFDYNLSGQHALNLNGDFQMCRDTVILLL